MLCTKPYAGCDACAPNGRACKTKTLAAILLLLSIGSACAEDYRWGGPAVPAQPSAVAPRTIIMATRPRSEAGPVIREGQVASLKAALNLKPSQQQYWVPVEAALNALVREEMRASESSMASTAVKLRRLRLVATPLIRALDDTQRREAIQFARRMGYGRLVASF